MAAAITVVLVLAAVASAAKADLAADRAECTEQLTVLLPCLAYVQGEARTPTQDCCSDAKTVVDKSFRCLCMLVKYRNDPDLGLKLNVSRAVTLPGLCNVPANISDCPKLLKLPPGSAAAHEFYELEGEIARNAQAKAKSTNIVDSKNTTASTPSCSAILKGTFLIQICLTLQSLLFLMLF